MEDCEYIPLNFQYTDKIIIMQHCFILDLSLFSSSRLGISTNICERLASDGNDHRRTAWANC